MLPRLLVYVFPTVRNAIPDVPFLLQGVIPSRVYVDRYCITCIAKRSDHGPNVTAAASAPGSTRESTANASRTAGVAEGGSYNVCEQPPLAHTASVEGSSPANATDLRLADELLVADRAGVRADEAPGSAVVPLPATSAASTLQEATTGCGGPSAGGLAAIRAPGAGGKDQTGSSEPGGANGSEGGEEEWREAPLPLLRSGPCF